MSSHPEIYRDDCTCISCINLRIGFREIMSNIPADDPVNHPKHYCQHPSGIECIEITRHYNFAIGNAMKYLWRNGLKDGQSDVQDLKKAIWYINDEISQREKCATNLTKQK